MFCSTIIPIHNISSEYARRLKTSKVQFGRHATASRRSLGKRPCANRFAGQGACQRIVAVQNAGASPEYPRAPQGAPTINSPTMVPIPTPSEVLSFVGQQAVSFLRFLISVGELVPKLVFPKSTLFSRKLMFQLARDSIVVLVVMVIWMLMLYPLDVAAFRFRWAIQAVKTIFLKT